MVLIGYTLEGVSFEDTLRPSRACPTPCDSGVKGLSRPCSCDTRVSCECLVGWAGCWRTDLILNPLNSRFVRRGSIGAWIKNVNSLPSDAVKESMEGEEAVTAA